MKKNRVVRHNDKSVNIEALAGQYKGKYVFKALCMAKRFIVRLLKSPYIYIEEHFRFKKQQHGFEDFRVRTLNAIRAPHQLVTLLAGYLALLTQQPDTIISCVLRDAVRAVPRSIKRKPKKFSITCLPQGLRNSFKKPPSIFMPISAPALQTPLPAAFPLFASRRASPDSCLSFQNMTRN